MNRRLLYPLSIIALALAACLFVLPWVARKLAIVSVGLSANEESQAVLQTMLGDLKTLSRFDPAHDALYRRHFERTQSLLHHLQILALSREELTRRAEAIVFALFGAIVALTVTVYLVEQRRRERLRERQRVHHLEHLSSWQEAARRHAHEMRTPLTTARMEVTALVRSLAPRVPDASAELSQREESILEELERLRRFANNFVAFASLPSPVLKRCDLSRVAVDFRELFAPNWPQLTLRTGETPSGVCTMADASMLRQVLVNLCNNSALAVGADGQGTVVLSVSADAVSGRIDVADDGPGIPPEIRRHLFEPYTTTRKIGEGMGLGLAISKKILLDHGGDLELLEPERGTAFRLILPRVEC